MLLRRVCFAALLVCFQRIEMRTYAQSISALQLDTEKVDVKAFAAFFRRVNAYESLAKSAKSPDVPQARLGSVVPREFQLSEAEAESLHDLAEKWQQDSAPLRVQVKTTVQQYRALFHAPVVRPDTTEALGTLRSLERQLDALTLHYRDSFRNTMPEPEFQRVRTQVESTFASSQSPIR